MEEQGWCEEALIKCCWWKSMLYTTCINMYAWKSTAKFQKSFGHTPLRPRENQRHHHVANLAKTTWRHYHPSLGRIYCQNRLAYCRHLVIQRGRWILSSFMIYPSCVGNQRCTLGHVFSMMVLPAKLGKPTSDLQGRKAKPLGSLMHLPFSPIFTRNWADVVQVCQEDCDDMWWHVMTCWKMWWVRWPRSGRVAKIFICTVLGSSAVWALSCCHFEVWMSWPKDLGVVGCGWRSCYKCSQHPSTGFSLI